VSLPVGIHYDIPPELYYADPCDTPSLSASIAHLLASKSPYHAWLAHPRFGRRSKSPTRAMDLGSICHALLLGTGKEYVVIAAPEGEPEFEDFKKKAARELRDAARASGKIPLLPKQLRDAVAVADSIKPQLKEHGVTLSGASEVTVVWEERADDGTIVRCRGMLDHLTEEEFLIDDLKIVNSAHPKACQSHLVGFGGDVQSAAYVSAIEKLRPRLAGRLEFRFSFCEVSTGVVTPVSRAGSMRELGAMRWRRAVNTWARCLRTNEWPAYVRGLTAVEAPAWALSAEMDMQFSETWRQPVEPDGPSSDGELPVPGVQNDDDHTDDLAIF
jgi:hypothetical protein